MFSVRSIFGPRLRSSTLLLQSSSASYSASSAAAIQAERTISEGPRNDWTRGEIKSIYDSPVLDLLFHGVGANYLSFSLLSLSVFVFVWNALFGSLKNQWKTGIQFFYPAIFPVFDSVRVSFWSWLFICLPERCNKDNKNKNSQL